MRRLLAPVALFACLAAPLPAQQWGTWAPGRGAFGDWHWASPVADAAALALITGAPGECVAVMDVGAVYCWGSDEGDWVAQGGSADTDDQTAAEVPYNPTASGLVATDVQAAVDELAADPGVSDHGALTGLGDDDHSQYALLAGRVGGQEIYGGPSSADAFTLFGNSDDDGPYIKLWGTGTVLRQGYAQIRAAGTGAVVAESSDGSNYLLVNPDGVSAAAFLPGFGSTSLTLSILGTMDLAWGVSGTKTLHGDTSGDLTLTGGNLIAPGVSATTFTGALVGNADSATTASDVGCTGCLTTADLGADSVAASELDATAVESELEAVLDLQDQQGAVTDAQVPNGITVDLAAVATTANGVAANSVALGTDTTGPYAASVSEGGAASDLACTTCVAAAEVASDVATQAELDAVDAAAAKLAGATFTGTTGVDNAQGFRLFEADANGSNYVEFVAPSALTSNTTCTLENDGNPIPDSCVGDGVDASGGAVPGSTTQVIFNDAGAEAGDAGFTYNKTTDTATIGAVSAVGTSSVGGIEVSTSTSLPLIYNRGKGAAATRIGLDNSGSSGIRIWADTIDLNTEANNRRIQWVGADPALHFGLSTYLAWNNHADPQQGSQDLAVGRGAASSLRQDGGNFTAAGDAATQTRVVRRSTTTATPAELFLDGSSARMALANDTTWTFECMVVARRTDADGEGAGYTLVGVIDRQTNAASTALIGTVTTTVLAEDNAAWDVAATADTTNGALILTVTGEASKTIRWVARCETVETTG